MMVVVVVGALCASKRTGADKLCPGAGGAIASDPSVDPINTSPQPKVCKIQQHSYFALSSLSFLTGVDSVVSKSLPVNCKNT